MRKKRRYKRSGKLSIIFISIIVSLGLLGVGYGYWTDSLKIVADIRTGSADVWGNIESSTLKVDVSEDGKTIKITGEVPYGFQEQLTLFVRNNGTVPMAFNIIKDIETSDIAELSRGDAPKYALHTEDINNDIIETFNLNILIPEIEEKESEKEVLAPSTKSSTKIPYDPEQRIEKLQKEIESLEKENKDLEKKIEKLSVVEKHKFEYKLHFIQGVQGGQ